VDWYASAPLKAVNAEIDFDDNMTWTLHGSGYALSRFADDYVNDLTSELATGGGYTSGGMAAGVVGRTLTVANSWGTQRAASTTYAVGDVVRPAAANGFLYRATSAGATGAGLPTYPTVLGQTVVDGAVTWECYGRAIIVFLAANQPSWVTATFTGVRYLVLSDRTAGTAATQPLIAVTDFVTDQAGGGGTWAVTPHPQLGNFHLVIQ
jgi:hypothetical protein